MKRSFVDRVAFTLPSLGSLIPAVLIFKNTQNNLKFEPWEAGVTAVVMEGIGFSSIATALDTFEQLQAEGKRWSGQLGIAIGGVAAYLVVGLLINALLDTGDWPRRITLSLLTFLPVIGGLITVLRNQLQKRQAALVQADVDAKAEQARQAALQAQREQDEIDYQRKLQQDEIAFQSKLKEEALRLEHDLKVQRLKHRVSESSRKVAVEPVQVAPTHNQPPDTFGKWRSWAELPGEQRLRVAETVQQARTADETTYKKVSAKWIIANFGVEERSAYMWIKYAERDYPAANGGVP
jgi:hypothetical protein